VNHHSTFELIDKLLILDKRLPAHVHVPGVSRSDADADADRRGGRAVLSDDRTVQAIMSQNALAVVRRAASW
jgi:hypothetical protein